MECGKGNVKRGSKGVFVMKMLVQGGRRIGGPCVRAAREGAIDCGHLSMILEKQAQSLSGEVWGLTVFATLYSRGSWCSWSCMQHRWCACWNSKESP